MSTSLCRRVDILSWDISAEVELEQERSEGKTSCAVKDGGKSTMYETQNQSISF